jgi:hypothetical protein
LNRAVTYAVHKFTLAASLVPSWHKRIRRKLSWTNIARSRTHLSGVWAEAKKYISEEKSQPLEPQVIENQ